MIFGDFVMSVRKTSAKLSEKQVYHQMQEVTIQEATQKLVHCFKWEKKHAIFKFFAILSLEVFFLNDFSYLLN